MSHSSAIKPKFTASSTVPVVVATIPPTGRASVGEFDEGATPAAEVARGHEVLQEGDGGLDRRRDRGERKVAEAARDRTIFETFHEVGEATPAVCRRPGPRALLVGNARSPPTRYITPLLQTRRKSTPHSSLMREVFRRCEVVGQSSGASSSSTCG